ncbi:S-protein-like protein [Thalictrum thalictroides]|uniref:S-protein homolog n=1 Tax=Thalictrum thalictroides TaxID=46969 RepID=A0A7J6VLX4_THATH|nr:S-protein-like protein [Thalictrum thalictroides]
MSTFSIRIRTFLLVSLVLIVYNCAPAACANIQWAHNYVEIHNDLAHQTPLTLHCRSKDDDLGVHVIRYGDNQNWRFSHNIWGSTLFWCSMEWTEPRTKRTVHGSFDVYSPTIVCGDCIYSVRQDGIWRLGYKAFKLVYKWPQN